MPNGGCMPTDVEKLENMEVTVPAMVVAQTRATSASAPDAISAVVGTAFGRIAAFQAEHGLPAAGAPRVIYTDWSPTGVKFTAAIPIAQAPPPQTRDVAIATIPESRALRFVHRGPYRDLRFTYERIEAWLRERGAIRTMADWARYTPMWEEYVNDPATTLESDLITRIYLTLP